MKTILVIDDDEDILGLAKKKLEKNGYRVLVEQKSEQGFNRACQERPNLILLDIGMPEKDGFDVLRELKSHDTVRGIPVIMLTAKTETSSIAKSQSLGASDYFIKPLNWEDTLKDIRKYIPMTS